MSSLVIRAWMESNRRTIRPLKMGSKGRASPTLAWWDWKMLLHRSFLTVVASRVLSWRVRNQQWETLLISPSNLWNLNHQDISFPRYQLVCQPHFRLNNQTWSQSKNHKWLCRTRLMKFGRSRLKLTSLNVSLTSSNLKNSIWTCKVRQISWRTALCSARKRRAAKSRVRRHSSRRRPKIKPRKRRLKERWYQGNSRRRKRTSRKGSLRWHNLVHSKKTRRRLWISFRTKTTLFFLRPQLALTRPRYFQSLRAVRTPTAEETPLIRNSTQIFSREASNKTRRLLPKYQIPKKTKRWWCRRSRHKIQRRVREVSIPCLISKISTICLWWPSLSHI